MTDQAAAGLELLRHTVEPVPTHPEPLGAPPPAPSVEHHNHVLRQGTVRAMDLEERLVRILTPILEQAGEEASRGFQRHATNYLTAGARARDHALLAALERPDARRLLAGLALTAADLGVQSNSTMICVKPTMEQAAVIADPDGAPPENLHVTLAYLGEIDGDLNDVRAALLSVAANHAQLEGVVGGYGQFMTPGGPIGILLPDVPGLVELRVAVTEALFGEGIDYGRDHGFQPHLTVDTSPEDFEPDLMLALAGSPLTFTELLIVRGDTEILPLPLIGVPPVTAAGDPGWGTPSPNELIDVDALVATLRTKTDPVRLAVAELMMKKTLEGAGLSFDTTNPFVAKVLSQSASQVTHIADTTRENVMRTIRVSYEQGLSIPDTAKAIQAGMREAAPARARLIARTELAGAVNGGSLAATQIASDALGVTYSKVWMTAPGAKDPRHEDYDGLDGQEVGLDETFEVGSDELQFPGDPDGSPEEICNCRCTMSYNDASGEGEVDADG